MADIYALLVAIDKYPEGIRSLAGCVNDAGVMEDLLTTRFGVKAEKLVRLNNEEAKRDRVIQTFREHLGQAGKEDIVLFFYAGHGSQVPTGGLFEEIEPDGMNESIVCYDSRLLGAYDLVDKDIATLIGELTAKGVHVTTIFDSCHSGSVTRDLEDVAGALDATAWERRLEPRTDPQPEEAYLANPAVQTAAIRDIPSPAAGMGSLTLAAAAYAPDQTGKHVLLAACEDNQTAKEYFGGGKRHGAFTYFLTETLKNATEPLGYRELMHQVRSAVQRSVAMQRPKLESSGGDAIFDNLFLGLKPSPWTDYAIARVGLSSKWAIDRGSMMRVAVGDRFALFPMSAGGAELADAAKAVAFAAVVSVTPATAALQLETGAQADEGAPYKAVPISQAALVSVSFHGAPSGVAELEARMGRARTFRVGSDAVFRVLAKDSGFQVITGDGRKVLWPTGPNAADADATIAALNHMTLWQLRVELANPSTQIPAAWVEFVITQNPDAADEAAGTCPPLRQIEWQCERDASGAALPRAYKAAVTNKSPGVLYTALLAFSDDWSISTKLLGAGTQQLGAGETVYAKSGQAVRCWVPEGATESTDDLLLIVSTDLFDALDFKMPALKEPGVIERSSDADEDEDPAPTHDFFTRRVTIHTTLKGS
jgi:hypothetical protein